MMTDKILIRAKDIGLLISILTLFGFLFGPMKKIFVFEQTVVEVAELKSEMQKASEIATDNKVKIAIVNTQYVEISKQLDQINWQLRRMRDDRR